MQVRFDWVWNSALASADECSIDNEIRLGRVCTTANLPAPPVAGASMGQGTPPPPAPNYCPRIIDTEASVALLVSAAAAAERAFERDRIGRAVNSVFLIDSFFDIWTRAAAAAYASVVQGPYAQLLTSVQGPYRLEYAQPDGTTSSVGIFVPTASVGFFTSVQGPYQLTSVQGPYQLAASLRVGPQQTGAGSQLSMQGPYRLAGASDDPSAVPRIDVFLLPEDASAVTRTHGISCRLPPASNSIDGLYGALLTAVLTSVQGPYQLLSANGSPFNVIIPSSSAELFTSTQGPYQLLTSVQGPFRLAASVRGQGRQAFPSLTSVQGPYQLKARDDTVVEVFVPSGDASLFTSVQGP
jgi:hypothetical protein